jgi:hypothetical protein
MRNYSSRVKISMKFPCKFSLQCPLRVNPRNTQHEEISSALPPTAEVGLARAKALSGLTEMDPSTLLFRRSIVMEYFSPSAEGPCSTRRIRHKTRSPSTLVLARIPAKIGHSFATAGFGLEAFEAAYVNHLVKAEASDWNYWIGGYHHAQAEFTRSL